MAVSLSSMHSSITLPQMNHALHPCTIQNHAFSCRYTLAYSVTLALLTPITCRYMLSLATWVRTLEPTHRWRKCTLHALNRLFHRDIPCIACLCIRRSNPTLVTRQLDGFLRWQCCLCLREHIFPVARTYHPCKHLWLVFGMFSCMYECE